MTSAVFAEILEREKRRRDAETDEGESRKRKRLDEKVNRDSDGDSENKSRPDYENDSDYAEFLARRERTEQLQRKYGFIS